MDAQQIKSERIVERYLTGDLLVREARDFERFCMDHPDILQTLAIPVRIKAMLSVKKSFDEMDTSVFAALPSSVSRIAAATGLRTLDVQKSNVDEDDDADEESDAARSGGKFTKILLVALVLALAGAGALLLKTQEQEQQIKKLSVSAKALKLQAPGSMQTLRIVPSETQANEPHATVSLNQAQLLDVYLNVSNTPYNNFAITIDKVDEARILQVRRIVADTNREVRFGLNSSAFGAGQYEIKLEGYNYKGQTSEVGWVLLELQ